MRSPKNRQVNVPLPRDSEMEFFYEQEARTNGVRLPTHFYQILKKRYEEIISGGQPTIPLSAVRMSQPPADNGKITTSVAEALAAFGGEDEDE